MSPVSSSDNKKRSEGASSPLGSSGSWTPTSHLSSSYRSSSNNAAWPIIVIIGVVVGGIWLLAKYVF